MMKVIRVGSVRRSRSSFAARPTATRSRERSSSTASASEIRSPSSALSRIAATGPEEPVRGDSPLAVAGKVMSAPALRCRSRARKRRRRPARPPTGPKGHSWGTVPCGSRRHRLLVDEAELRDVVELAHVARELEEGQEAGALARAEAVAELLEVA